MSYKEEEAFEEGKNSQIDANIKIVEFFRKSWENDKDAIFNEGYMEKLFEELKQQLQEQKK